MQLIDGKAVAAAIKVEIAEEVRHLMAAGGKQPHLAAVLVGHDGGSETYVKNKVLACEQCGFKSTLIRFEEDVTQEELLACVDSLNKDADIDGFIVQLPLPKHIDEQRIIEAIDYRKDVDGFHPVNVGRMNIGLPCFISATPLGIITLLQRYNIPTSGKQCVILGRSNIDDAETIWRCHCYGLPLPHPKHCRYLSPSRHHHCGNRYSQFRKSRHGEARSSGY